MGESVSKIFWGRLGRRWQGRFFVLKIFGKRLGDLELYRDDLFIYALGDKSLDVCTNSTKPAYILSDRSALEFKSLSYTKVSMP